MGKGLRGSGATAGQAWESKWLRPIRQSDRLLPLNRNGLLGRTSLGRGQRRIWSPRNLNTSASQVETAR